MIYDENDQRRILADMYEQIEGTAAMIADEFGSSTDRDTLARIEITAGHLLADVTGLLAPCLKDPSFHTEEEWRLFRLWFEGRHFGPEFRFPLEFRRQEDLVVPYTEFSLKAEAIRRLVMGYQVPEHPARQSLRLLLEASGIDPEKCVIEKSNVPVRGAA